MSKLYKFTEITNEQLQAVEYLALPGRGGMTFVQIAEACGVSERTLQRWRKIPEFQEAVRSRSVQLMGEALPDVLDAIVKRAVSGSGKHAELVLKALGLLREHQIVETRTDEDPRSTEAIERDIEELHRQLEEIGVNIEEETH